MVITDEHCVSCGACCQSARPVTPPASWANCSAADVARMPRRHRLKLLPVRQGDENMMATPLRADGTCTFLRGVIGERVQCAIYDVRPTICRLYKAGSELCRDSRREIGLPA